MGAHRRPSGSGRDPDHGRDMVWADRGPEIDAGPVAPVLWLLDLLCVLRPVLGGPVAPVAMGPGLPLGIRAGILAGWRGGRHRADEVRAGRDHEGAVRPTDARLERVRLEAALRSPLLFPRQKPIVSPIPPAYLLSMG